MIHSEIRRIFYDFFLDKKHTKVLSAPLVPAKDRTLLFTNAGMNQFKGVFLNQEKREYNRAVSIQKCMRVSGKHNDFDEVGKTDYHHTFFEMMGNFSFGDYFKERACEYAWKLLTGPFGFDPENLWITIFQDDDEAFNIWEEEIGVPPHKIIRFGEKENFWQMGETGPCGPCSEIHFDRGADYGPDEFTEDNKRFVEIWNLVFMQYFKDETGSLHPLPAPSIDTGMGLERLASVIQGVPSNYDTDLFVPIIDFAADLAGVNPDTPENRIDLNVIGDHARALAFLISDGVLPSNDGRGYVLRRLIRRAAKHGKSLGFKDHFIHKVTGKVVELMTDFYPELSNNRTLISEIVQAEEERFHRTLLNGLKRFEDILSETIAGKQKKIPGDQLFKLSDTYGFPLDFARDLAMEKEISIDFAGFQKALDGQREKSRASLRKSQKSDSLNFPDMPSEPTEFVGYDNLSTETTVLALLADNKPVDSLEENRDGIAIFKHTPFYAQAGGQIGDSGEGKSEHSFFTVRDTQKTGTPIFLHNITVKKGTLKKGDSIRVSVDRDRRQAIASHHTATHLLHYGLREVLGLHVKQAGSFVGQDKLRFDFTHYKAMTPEEIEAVEKLINEKIRSNQSTGALETSYQKALEDGAIAIFDEKYTDTVRMISVGDFSKELCGGTHVHATGDIGILKIINESSISSGIRRIEAVAGAEAYRYIHRQLKLFRDLQEHFKQKPDTILAYLKEMEQDFKEKEKRLKRQSTRDSRESLQKTLDRKEMIGEIPVTVDHLENIQQKELGLLSDNIRKKTGGIAILTTNINKKSAIVVSVPPEFTKKLHAGIIIKEIAGMVGGNGGGKPEFAQAGGKSVQDVPAFRQKVMALLRGRIQ